MSESGSDGPSFDPRSWRVARPDSAKPEPAEPQVAPPPPRPTAEEAPTFDPKSWARPRQAAPASRRSGPSPGFWLAGIIGALVVVGGVGFVVTRPHPKPSPKAVAAPPPAAPTPHPAA